MDEDRANDQTTIIDGQIDESAATDTATNSKQSQAELVVSLTGLINSNLAEIGNLEKEMAKHREMVDSVLDNDPTYIEHASAAKEAARIKGNTKREIFKRPDVKHIVDKLLELKQNLTDTKEELSNYIQEYASVSGQNYFEAEDGTIQEIVYTAKLRKKRT